MIKSKFGNTIYYMSLIYHVYELSLLPTLTVEQKRDMNMEYGSEKRYLI